MLLFHTPGDEMNNESEPVPLFYKESTMIEQIILNTYSLSTAKNVDSVNATGSGRSSSLNRT